MKRVLGSWPPKAFALFLVGISSLCLPGCYDIQEVDDMNLVLAIGVDETEDHLINVTAEFVNPSSAPSSGQDGSSTSGGKQPVIVRQETGASIEDAMGKFEREIPHSVYLAQNMLVLFGESYARNGIDRALDFFERDRAFRRNQLFLVTPNAASDVLSASVDPEPLNALGIRELVEQSSTQLRFVQSEQQQIMEEYLSPSQSPVMALISLQSVGRPALQGVAVFRGGRLVDTLNVDEMQGLGWLLGSTRQVSIHLPCAGEDGAGTTIRILGSNTKFQAQPGQRDLNVQLQVHARAEVEQICPREKLDEKTFKDLNRMAAAYIQRSMQTTIAKLQQDDVDASQFGKRVFLQNPCYSANQ
ncbi:Ger(x)C family germination protein [Alicyclobacillus sacchari]|uniref:Ger(X)C family germination protein n=2 Tax=Alicyclobacillus sacchari TaxID=392010 RepID=A0A4R8LKM5_9BACL|nr:Ger(x)C family germination protein [Alicyclobacillus sacchari]